MEPHLKSHLKSHPESSHDLRGAPIGKKVPAVVEAIVEIPKESRVKYEFDPPTGLFRVSRLLPRDMVYPVNYGFIPSTLSNDDDCMDVLILDTPPLIPGTILSVEVLAALHLLDRGVEDFKILGRPASLSAPKGREPEEPDPAVLEVVRHFFQHYKELEKTPVEILEWIEREQAKEIVRNAHERYRKQDEAILAANAF